VHSKPKVRRSAERQRNLGSKGRGRAACGKGSACHLAKQGKGRSGLGLNSMEFPRIYKSILSYRRFPDGLFTGAAWRMTALRTLMPPPSKSR